MRFCRLIQRLRERAVAFFNVVLTLVVAGYYFIQAIALLIGKIFARLLKRN